MQTTGVLYRERLIICCSQSCCSAYKRVLDLNPYCSASCMIDFIPVINRYDMLLNHGGRILYLAVV